jgi:hypothetical protein
MRLIDRCLQFLGACGAQLAIGGGVSAPYSANLPPPMYMKSPKWITPGLAALILGCATLSPIAHATPLTALASDGVDGTGSGHSNNDIGGWTFINTDAIVITSLGMWAGSDLALATSHQLGIYDLGGGLQVGTTISGSGTSSNADNYVFQDLATPFVLNPGLWFVGATYNAGNPDNFLVLGDSGTFASGPFTVGNGIQFIDNRVYYQGAVGGAVFSGKTFLGANFQYENVPDSASTFLLFGLASSIVVVARRRFTAAKA